MYIHRIFFRKDTGNLIHHYDMQGDIIIPTVEQDLTSLSSLKDYSRDAIEVIEIDKNDLETREKIRTATGIMLDVETKELIFDFTSEQIEEQERKATLEERVSDLENLLLMQEEVI